MKLLKSASFNIAKCTCFRSFNQRYTVRTHDIAIEHNAIPSLIDLIKSDIPVSDIVFDNIFSFYRF